jgi:hypothetical protein
MAVFILKYLGTVLGHHSGYVDIKNLAGLVAYIVKSTGGRRAPINLNRLNYIRIIDFLQVGTNMARLSAFFPVFGFGFLFQ